LEAQLKKMSRLGSDGKETVVVNQMDTATTAQLKSLGYVAGFSDRNIEVDGKGPDAKDHLNTLKVLQTVGHGSDANAIPIARKVELLEEALRDDPLDPTLNYSLIQAYQQNGQYQQALQVCLNTMQHGIHDGMILSQTANLYLRLGNIKEAISYYQQAAQLNPLDVEGQNDLATAYVQVGRIADAERVYKWVLAIQPYAPAYNGLGIIAVKNQDYADARKNFEHAIQLDPTYVEGQLNLGIVCAQTHDFPCARNAFKVFVANAPPSYGKVILQAKSALARMGNGRS
jgi:tetratricopeptide (TPR) repeat protein